MSAFLGAQGFENLTSNVFVRLYRSGRHGLFTSYAPLSIGDNSMYQQKKRKFFENYNVDNVHITIFMDISHALPLFK